MERSYSFINTPLTLGCSRSLTFTLVNFKCMELWSIRSSGWFYIVSVFVPLKQRYAGEGTVALYAAPNPFLLDKICLNQQPYISNSFNHYTISINNFFNDFYSPTSKLYWSEIALKNFYLTLKSTKFLKIHLEMEWVDPLTVTAA